MRCRLILHGSTSGYHSHTQSTSVTAGPPGVQVMSWELLTRTKFYGQHADMAAVVDALLGNKQLPTEQPLTAEVKKGLGNKVYRDSIVGALARDPAQRPSVAQLVEQWTSVFQHATFVSE